MSKSPDLPYYGEAVSSTSRKLKRCSQKSPDTNYSALKINKLTVKFPHPKPYPAQNTMMWKIIMALDQEKNALVESPTGSGKTISFLCSAIAWLKTHKKDKVLIKDDNLECARNLKNELDQGRITMDQYVSDTAKLQLALKDSQKSPRIWIGTRTHQQIGQIISELKDSPYSHNIDNSCLASRERMCVNPRAKNHETKSCNDACSELVKNRHCKYHTAIQKGPIDNHAKLDSLMRAGITPHYGVWDIEDLVEKGKQQEFCPYYAAQRVVAKQAKGSGQWVRSSAEIIVCPYQYLIDPSVRSNFDIKNDIIIIDEAHNIEGQCREAASLRLSKKDLDDMISSIESVIETYKKWMVEYNNTNEKTLQFWDERVVCNEQLMAVIKKIGLFLMLMWDDRRRYNVIQDSYRKTNFIRNWESKSAVLSLFKVF